MGKVEIKKSEIHGEGLFAAEDIKEGEVVAIYSGLELCPSVISGIKKLNCHNIDHT